MATDTPVIPKSADRIAAEALVAIVAAWILPGLGHLLMRRWGRAIFLFLAVGGLALAGFAMRGELFTRQSTDPFGALGFLADACMGAFYFLPHVMKWAGPDISRAAGDYGTRFLAAAGVVNLLGMTDAYRIASGRKH
jgi:predicted membrane channel-forming protein YqfA (hemolysin III family)